MIFILEQLKLKLGNAAMMKSKQIINDILDSQLAIHLD